MPLSNSDLLFLSVTWNHDQLKFKEEKKTVKKSNTVIRQTCYHIIITTSRGLHYVIPSALPSQSLHFHPPSHPFQPPYLETGWQRGKVWWLNGTQHLFIIITYYEKTAGVWLPRPSHLQLNISHLHSIKQSRRYGANSICSGYKQNL